MKKEYPVHFCLKKETDFEDFHPLFNKDKNELLLPIDEIDMLIDQCHEKCDNIGISYGGEVSGKWDVLEVHGVGGGVFDLEYQVGIQGGSFFARGINKDQVIEAILNLSVNEPDLKSSGFEFICW